MDSTKVKKKMYNDNYYRKHKERVKEINKLKSSDNYKNEEFRKKKIEDVRARYYVNSAIMFVRKLYV